MVLGRVTAATADGVERFELREGEVVGVGRSSACGIQLRDTKVSREHCHLRLIEGMLHVLDRGSSHGVVHQGERCTELLLEVGESFTVGNTTLRFEGLVEGTVQGAVEGAGAPIAAAAPEPAAPAVAPAAPPAPVAAPRAPTPPPAAPAEPARLATGVAAVDYPIVGVEKIARRRVAPPGKRFAARLAADSIVFSITAVIVVVLLLMLRMKSAAFDIYRVLDALGLPKP
ncbi:MAG: FHA domain-containing protein [Planctomycetota bacterium]